MLIDQYLQFCVMLSHENMIKDRLIMTALNINVKNCGPHKVYFGITVAQSMDERRS